MSLFGASYQIMVAGQATSHCMNQCWKKVNWTLWSKLEWNLNRNKHIFIQEIAFEYVVWKMASNLLHWVTERAIGNFIRFELSAHMSFVTWVPENQDNCRIRIQIQWRANIVYTSQVRLPWTYMTQPQHTTTMNRGAAGRMWRSTTGSIQLLFWRYP